MNKLLIKLKSKLNDDETKCKQIIIYIYQIKRIFLSMFEKRMKMAFIY
jgi:hypothetical protein